MNHAIDTNAGLQEGSAPHAGMVEVLVGYLVTHADGFQARLAADRTRADNYLRQHDGTRIEAMYVWRQCAPRPARD